MHTYTYIYIYIHTHILTLAKTEAHHTYKIEAHHTYSSTIVQYTIAQGYFVC